MSLELLGIIIQNDKTTKYIQEIQTRCAELNYKLFEQKCIIDNVYSSFTIMCGNNHIYETTYANFINCSAIHWW